MTTSSIRYRHKRFVVLSNNNNNNMYTNRIYHLYNTQNIVNLFTV